jgi:hypothetical protein
VCSCLVIYEIIRFSFEHAKQNKCLPRLKSKFAFCRLAAFELRSFNTNLLISPLTYVLITFTARALMSFAILNLSQRNNMRFTEEV